MIEGKLYPPNSADFQIAQMQTATAGDFQLRVDGAVVAEGALNELDCPPRLGNIERRLMLADGRVFASSDNDGIDAMMAQHISHGGLANRVRHGLHSFEHNIKAVVGALVLVVGLTVAFFVWGVPAASAWVAKQLPHKVSEIIGNQALETLDEYWFDDSKLSAAEQQKIQQRFKSKLLSVLPEEERQHYQLHFRSWTLNGIELPNAFALPSGDLLVTDKFIELSDKGDEVDAVLLHEIGHVAHHHSLQQLVHSALLTMGIAWVTGDVSGMADMGIGLATMMTQSANSRAFEAEADEYAFKHMLQLGIDPEAFASVMTSLEAHMLETQQRDKASDAGKAQGEKEGEKEGDNTANKNSAKPTEKSRHNDDKAQAACTPKSKKPHQHADNKSVMHYLSTHPPTEERVAIALRYSACFKRGEKICPNDSGKDALK